MTNEAYTRIRHHPLFNELVIRRNRFTSCLLTIIVTLFFIFIGLVSFQPKFIGERIFEHSTLTVGVVAEVFLFVLFLAASGLYVHRANREFDGTTRKLIDQVSMEDQS